MPLVARRHFLQFSTAALAASAGRILGANDRVNIAITGLGGRGTDHMESYAALPGARIAALVEAAGEDPQLFPRRSRNCEGMAGGMTQPGL